MTGYTFKKRLYNHTKSYAKLQTADPTINPYIIIAASVLDNMQKSVTIILVL